MYSTHHNAAPAQAPPPGPRCESSAPPNARSIDAESLGSSTQDRGSTTVPPAADSDPYLLSIVQDVEARLRGQCIPPLKEYQVQNHEWPILKELLEQHLDYDKCRRIDYFPHDNTFVHEMPSITHDGAVASVFNLIWTNIMLLCPPTEEGVLFRDNIMSLRSSDREDRKGRELHQPDDSIKYHKRWEHGLILEVAFSQKAEKLDWLAQFYLLHALLTVRVVVGLNLDYTGTKKAELLTWRLGNANIITRKVQEIRTESGEVVPGPPLKILFSDIAPEEVIPESLRGTAILIPVEQICNAIERAEAEEAEKTAYKLELKKAARKAARKEEAAMQGLRRSSRLRGQPPPEGLP